MRHVIFLCFPIIFSERAACVGGWCAARLPLLFSFPCLGDHKRDWPLCENSFFGSATNTLNMRNKNNHHPCRCTKTEAKIHTLSKDKTQLCYLLLCFEIGFKYWRIDVDCSTKTKMSVRECQNEKVVCKEDKNVLRDQIGFISSLA